MIIRRETLNAISTLMAENKSVATIAAILNVAVSDVTAAIKAFKL